MYAYNTLREGFAQRADFAGGNGVSITHWKLVAGFKSIPKSELKR